MNRNKKISTILASVSLLAIACSSAMAAPLLLGPTPPNSGPGLFTASDRDYIVLEDYTMEGDLIVNSDIGAADNEVGILLDNSTIEGDIYVEDNYAVIGSETDPTEATVAGIFSTDNSQIEGAIVNDGIIGGEAYAGVSNNAFALAGGSVTIGDDDPILQNLDDGVVYGYASASAYDSALAIAGGAVQVTLEEDATTYIENDGTISAEAWARSTQNSLNDTDYDENIAGAVALGAGQAAFGATVDMDIINGEYGEINVLADAYAVGYSTDGDRGAYAGAAGIGMAQLGVAFDEDGYAVADITNDGAVNVEVNANARAQGGGNFYTSNDADANAIGVGALQILLATNEDGSATATITNNGAIDVHVNVDAYSEDEDAWATGIALGVAQVVGTNEGAATADLVNNDSIHVKLVVSATATSEAYADAYAFGALQAVGSSSGAAYASITNSSPLSLDATATAYADGQTANANAYVIAAGQIVGSLGGTASANVTNDGSIQANANAYAEGDVLAEADADASAVSQLVLSLANGVSADVYNTSEIGAFAFADASASDGPAIASAGAFGVNQFGAAGGSIDLDVTNAGGSISGTAVATAIAEYDTARAYATGTGVAQSALGGSVIDFSIVNSGDISGNVLAYASGEDAYAEASGRGTYQSTFGTDGNVTADVTNTAGIFSNAHAYATAEYDAYATAEARGADQELLVVDGDVYGTVTNNGEIGAFAWAFASQTGGDDNSDAEARATATGVDQYGNALSSGTVELVLTNNSDLYATALSFATALYSAEAEADAMGVEQDAVSQTNAMVNTINTGLISPYAFASANAFYSDADAEASATGVDQGAYSENGNATTVASNTGILSTIRAVASAVASSVYSTADADAVAQGVVQDPAVFGAGLAWARMTNEGIVSSYAFADATSVYDFAEAHADATAIDQEVYSEDGEALGEVYSSGDVYATAVAEAESIYSDAYAVAEASGVEQDVYADNNATALVDNTGYISADGFADAEAYGDAYAEANVFGINQKVGSNDDVARGDVLNAADSFILAYGSAYASSLEANAYASASVTGISQRVSSGLEDEAYATVSNDGTVWATGYAAAIADNGSAYAEADVFGVDQFVRSSTGAAYADVTNTSGIFAYADAEARVENDTGADAYASASATGVDQAAISGNNAATVTADNSGIVGARADGYAYSGYGSAYAEAAAIGVDQYGHAVDNGDALTRLNNSSTGDIYATGLAWAQGWTAAYASASVTGVEQDAFSGNDSATATILNDGSIYAGAFATANGTGQTANSYFGATYASAGAFASGVNQVAWADEYATASVTNTSFFSIDGVAIAYATGTESAVAEAGARGVFQAATGVPPGDTEVALVETINSGRISAFAAAYANTTVGDDFADATASAYASATGLAQIVAGNDSSTARLNNSGDITAESYARADGARDYAQAVAIGHGAESFEDLTLDVLNTVDGRILAYADASAYDSAAALAAGSWFEAFEGSDLQGTVVNAGLISGSAFATAYTATASAFGIVEVSSGANNVDLTNSGIVSAFAEGWNAYATGIAIAAIAGPGGDEYDLATINNEGGVIYAAVKQPDEDVVHRGNAINTRGFTTFNGREFLEAPNAVDINLRGGAAGSAGKEIVEQFDLVSPEVQDALSENDSYGYVYGNIQIITDDNINVTDGVTIFDGIINSDGVRTGDLRIFDDGKLVMVQNDIDLPSKANVELLDVDSTGTLIYELTPLNNEGTDYSQIFANTADIEDGNFIALYRAGFYADATLYDNIIVSNNRIGEFGNVDDNSALLKTTAFYDFDGDSDQNVDLYVERIAFDDVSDMTKNQKSVGGAIENVYTDIDPDTDFGRLVANLFTLDDGDYQSFLDQLTGAEHAEHLRSVLYSTRAINRIITERMECDGETYAQQASATNGAKVDGNTVMPTADAPMATGCFEPGTTSIWMRGFGQWNNLGGDDEAPGFDETQYGLLFGADYAFDENWFLGVAGGYFNSDADFDDWGGRPGTDYTYDGLQLAAYGGYDNSTYYLRGVISYGNYEGESNRLISFKGSPIDPKGDPSSDTWSFYGETGYRFGITDYANITPFAGLSLATATLDSFTEKDDGTGAALDVHESDANSVASVLGIRLDGDMVMGSGVLTPSVSVAWMHEFEDTPEVDASFESAPSGADFTVIASEVARDSIVIDGGAKYDVNGSVNFGLYYSGQFNEDYSSNAITARLGYKF